MARRSTSVENASLISAGQEHSPTSSLPSVPNFPPTFAVSDSPRETALTATSTLSFNSSMEISKKFDGCGHHQHPHVHPSYLPPNQEDKSWLRRTHRCLKQMVSNPYKRWFKRESLETLQCDLAAGFNVTKEAVLHYNTVWFMGDSVLAQQFYALLCMVNPDLNVTQDMELYQPNGPADDLFISKYVHVHDPVTHHTSGNGRPKTTTFLHSKFGWKWGRHERNLYDDGKAFFTAIRNLTRDDAIVMDAAVHYSAERGSLMEKALTHIRDQAQKHANATVFYMEPTPEEWPTSNGIFADGCFEKCQCESLSQEQLQGHYNWNQSASAVQHVRRNPNHGQQAPSLEFVEKYGLLSNSNITTTNPGNTNQTTTPVHPHYQHEEYDCYPDCLPASWRHTVAHSIFNNATVAVVPIFWQLALKPTPTNVYQGDCTHRSYEGVVSMNQQLVRTMVERQVNQRRMPRVPSRERLDEH